MHIDRGGIRLDKSEDGTLDDWSNSLTYEGRTYVLRYLSEGQDGSKGGNSSVFVLCDPNGQQPDRAIKISNVYRPDSNTPKHFRRRYGRFIEEIEALRKCNEMEAPNIVRMLWDGVLTINEKLKGGHTVERKYPYYVMEKADTDLKEYLLREPDTDIQTRIQLC